MTLEKCEEFSFAFDPRACCGCGGKCCTGSTGYIWVTGDEWKQIAASLDLAPDIFEKIYLRKVGSRISLREIKRSDSWDCIFFNRPQARCAIYLLRPQQCRTFPFWDRFKKAGEGPPRECPGIVQP